MRTRILLIVAALSAAAYACGGVDPNSSLLGLEPDGGIDDAGSTHDASIRDSGIRDGAASNDASVIDSGHDGGIVIVHPFGDGSVVPTVCGTEADAAIVACTPDAPTCCANQGDGLVATDFSCTAGAAACTGTSIIPVQCRDDRDCFGGQVCCGDLPAVPDTYTSLTCADLAACPVTDDAGALTDFVRFCTPDASDPCPSVGQMCNMSSLLPGFWRCY
jgi:hypothetical protein